MTAPKPIPLNALTVYADLDQSLRLEIPGERWQGSISRKTVGDAVHLYADERQGPLRRQRYLGPEHDPAAHEIARRLTEQAERSRLRRRSIAMIKRAGVSGLQAPLAPVIEAVSDAGLFKSGLVLIGTAAYQLYPPVVCHFLSAGTLTTQDVDLAVATVAGSTQGGDILGILRRSDPTFDTSPQLDRKALPKKFRSKSGVIVELLTPVRTRADDGVVDIPRLGAGAVPLQYLSYLIEDAIEVTALAGSGFLVTVPQPARYAVHKLIVAQHRQADNPKRIKDLRQAEELMAIFRQSDPDVLDDAIRDAAERGPKWQAALAKAGLTVP
jgi:hypothetical protein